MSDVEADSVYFLPPRSKLSCTARLALRRAGASAVRVAHSKSGCLEYLGLWRGVHPPQCFYGELLLLHGPWSDLLFARSA